MIHAKELPKSDANWNNDERRISNLVHPGIRNAANQYILHSLLHACIIQIKARSASDLDDIYTGPRELNLPFPELHRSARAQIPPRLSPLEPPWRVYR